MKRIFLCVLGCLLAHPAYAYRPFNSTDAAVAKAGELEFECGPLGYVIDADGRFLVVPSAILNFGLTDEWELVIEGRNFLLVPPVGGAPGDLAGERPLVKARAAPGDPAGAHWTECGPRGGSPSPWRRR